MTTHRRCKNGPNSGARREFSAGGIAKGERTQRSEGRDRARWMRSRILDRLAFTRSPPSPCPPVRPSPPNPCDPGAGHCTGKEDGSSPCLRAAIIKRRQDEEERPATEQMRTPQHSSASDWRQPRKRRKMGTPQFRRAKLPVASGRAKEYRGVLPEFAQQFSERHAHGRAAVVALFHPGSAHLTVDRLDANAPPCPVTASWHSISLVSASSLSTIERPRRDFPRRPGHA